MFARVARRIGQIALDAVLPPTCVACAAIVDTPGRLCAGCWAQMHWIGAPLCDRCGSPFDYDPSPGATLVCAACTAAPPVFDRARAVFAYDDRSRRLILSFKHADRTQSAPAFGEWIARAGGILVDEADLIAPVPLHWLRLAWRRYNQAALIAQALAARCRKPVIVDLLTRRRNTPSQGHLSRFARARNVGGAFAVTDRHRAALAGKRVLLIDDVFTTGATAAACSRALLAGGAGAVDVLTLARVLRSVTPT